MSYARLVGIRDCDVRMYGLLIRSAISRSLASFLDRKYKYRRVPPFEVAFRRLGTSLDLD